MPLSMIYANENFSFTILNIIRWTILKNERVRRKKQSKCLFLENFYIARNDGNIFTYCEYSSS